MSSAAIPDAPAACRSRAKMLPTSPKPMIAKVVMLLPVLCIEVGRRRALRIRGEITTSILRFVPSHGLISLLPWELTASVADLETAAVNSPRILSAGDALPPLETKRQPLPDVRDIQAAWQQALLGRVAQGRVDGRLQGCAPEWVRITEVGARWSSRFGVPEHPHEFMDQIRPAPSVLAPATRSAMAPAPHRKSAECALSTSAVLPVRHHDAIPFSDKSSWPATA